MHLEVVDFIPRFPMHLCLSLPFFSQIGVGEVIDNSGDSSLASNLTVAQNQCMRHWLDLVSRSLSISAFFSKVPTGKDYLG